MYRGIAFIPARSGSKRLQDKNVKLLDGHPLLAYSINAAKKSGAFERVICATDSVAYAETARRYGAEVPALRPSSISDDTSTDIQWVDFMLREIQKSQALFDFFSILIALNVISSIFPIGVDTTYRPELIICCLFLSI